MTGLSCPRATAQDLRGENARTEAAAQCGADEDGLPFPLLLHRSYFICTPRGTESRLCRCLCAGARAKQAAHKEEGQWRQVAGVWATWVVGDWLRREGCTQARTHVGVSRVKYVATGQSKESPWSPHPVGLWGTLKAGGAAGPRAHPGDTGRGRPALSWAPQEVVKSKKTQQLLTPTRQRPSYLPRAG